MKPFLEFISWLAILIFGIAGHYYAFQDLIVPSIITFGLMLASAWAHHRACQL